MLSTPDDQLEVNTAKMKRLARRDLELATTEGTATTYLMTTLLTIRDACGADIQENEGLNSILKGENSRARNMTLATLDSRLRLKRCCGRCSGMQ